MYDIEYQWQQLLNDNIFTEEAIITDDETVYLHVKGVFYSGSYKEDSAAPYAPKENVDKDGFQMSAREIPLELENPTKALTGATLILPGRNLSFRIRSVIGNKCGQYTLRLQPNREEVDG